MLSPVRLLRHGRLLSTSSNPNLNPNPSSNRNTNPNLNPKPFEKPLRSLIKPILKQRDPDDLVSLFNLSSSDPRFRLHSPIYDATVRRLFAFGRPDAVESLIEHQKSHPEFSSSEPFAARLILLYGRAHMPSHALSTFNSLKCPRTSLSLNSLLSAFARSPDPDPDPTRIARLVQQIQSSHPDITPTVVSYNIIISALCDKQQFNQAMDVTKLMENKGISPNVITYNTLLHGFYSNDRFEDGEKIWDAMGEKDVRSYNSRLRGLVSAKGVKVAVEVFDEMLKIGVKPDIFSFNALIKGYCESGMVEDAKRVYLTLEKYGCEPQLKTFQMLIPAVWEAKEYDFVVRLCNESLNIGCFLEVEMLQRVLDGLAKEEMFAKAKKLIKHVRSKGFYGDKHLRVPLPCLAM